MGVAKIFAMCEIAIFFLKQKKINNKNKNKNKNFFFETKFYLFIYLKKRI